MIVLPVWVSICLCLPFVALAVMFVINGIAGLLDYRESERALRSGEEGIEKEKIDADT